MLRRMFEVKPAYSITCQSNRLRRLSFSSTFIFLVVGWCSMMTSLCMWDVQSLRNPLPAVLINRPSFMLLAALETCYSSLTETLHFSLSLHCLYIYKYTLIFALSSLSTSHYLPLLTHLRCYTKKYTYSAIFLSGLEVFHCSYSFHDLWKIVSVGHALNAEQRLLNNLSLTIICDHQCIIV